MAADTSYPPGVAQIRQDGNLAVPTGKSIDVESGGAFKLAGTDYTAALTNLALRAGAVASGRLSKWMVIPLAGLVGTTGGGVGSLLNPEGVTILVIRALVYTTVKSTGAANLAIGVAANITTSGNNLLDALDVGTAVVAADNITDGGTAGKARQKMTSTQAITATGSADSSGLVGTLFVEYIIP